MCSQSRAARRVYSIRSPQVRQILAETFAFLVTSSIRKIWLDILHPSGKSQVPKARYALVLDYLELVLSGI